jgi:serine/threonine protein phosphatase PrpC
VFDFLKKIFGQKEKADSEPKPEATTGFVDVKTAPLIEEHLDPDRDQEHVDLRPAQLLVGSAQSVGKQRDHNEDALYTFHAMFADGISDIPFGIFVVADGMGGHEYGEIASRLAAKTIAEYLLKKLYLPFLSPDPEPSGESLQEVMEQGVKQAQQVVLRRAPGGGTTLTAALILGEQVTIAHVGDSRAYLIYPDGRMRAVTQDHSLVRRLVELGQITEAEAAVHPNRNVVYRALGQTEPFRPDVETRQLPHPGYVMVCSDGLWGVVPDAQMFKIIHDAPNPSIACHQLVEAANAAGGPDNISVVLVQYL